jgi:TLD
MTNDGVGHSCFCVPRVVLAARFRSQLRAQAAGQWQRRHVQAAEWRSGRWHPLGLDDPLHLPIDAHGGSVSVAASNSAGSATALCRSEPPFQPLGSPPSVILTADGAASLRAAMPWRVRSAAWTLRYSTTRDGFSLRTLYRAGAACSHSVLLIRDFSGTAFGAFCTAAWRVSPRYQGNFETFVFQLSPRRLKFAWAQAAGSSSGNDGATTSAAPERNDFFMLLSPESAAVGGAPRFALWLDAALLHGTSGPSGTFQNPVLSGAPEFKVKAVELWQVGADAPPPKGHSSNGGGVAARGLGVALGAL